MKLRTLLSNRFRGTMVALIITSAFNLWDYFQGGVPTHYFLADEDLPGFSNWWGMLTIPVLTWLVITLNQSNSNNGRGNERPKLEMNFLVAFIYGLAMAFLWEFRMEEILQYAIFLPLVVSFFRPVHFPESLLGFVLGMLFTFGGVLPIIIGSVLLVFGLLINKVLRKGMLLLVARVTRD